MSIRSSSRRRSLRRNNGVRKTCIRRKSGQIWARPGNVHFQYIQDLLPAVANVLLEPRLLTLSHCCRPIMDKRTAKAGSLRTFRSIVLTAALSGGQAGRQGAVGEQAGDLHQGSAAAIFG